MGYLGRRPFQTHAPIKYELGKEERQTVLGTVRRILVVIPLEVVRLAHEGLRKPLTAL